MTDWRKRLLWAAPLALIVAFLAYEGWAVGSAKARTPAILKQVAERPLALDSVPKARVDMLLAVEDPGFWRHKGIDFSTPGQGMTNLTQSLVKQLYFEKFKPGFPKIEQALIARYVLHPALSKRDQLEVFLNYASFGRRQGAAVKGFPAAARAYYGKDFQALSEDEYLSLVAMLIGPKLYDPVRQPAANAERVRRIKTMLAGQCAPKGLKDVYYEGC
jgi:membrane peptidoglycan carboxypeptidase